jgi:hypothetical protein
MSGVRLDMCCGHGRIAGGIVPTRSLADKGREKTARL